MPRLYPPEHPLGSACLKIERANVHIRGLNAAIRRSARQPEIAVSGKGKLKFLSNSGDLFVGPDLIDVDIDPRVGLTWGLIVGDILSNLRASLDHIAWALAMKHTTDHSIILDERQKRSIGFPLRITAAAKPSFGGLSSDDVRFLPPQAFSDIERFQPYNRTNWPELKLLGVLAELTNEDKHRVVTPVRREVGVRLSGDDQFTRTYLNKPDKFQFLVTDSERNHLKPEATFDVVLHVPFLGLDTFSVSEFRLIHDLIRDKVIPAFASFFP